MIIPDTPLYNAKSDAEFRLRMIQHIKDAYAEVLGKDVKLLDLPNGLDLVQAKIAGMLYDSSRGEIDLRRSPAAQRDERTQYAGTGTAVGIDLHADAAVGVDQLHVATAPGHGPGDAE